MLISSRIVQFLVYLYHIAGLIVCLYSKTSLHHLLFIDYNFAKGLLFPFLIAIACFFYFLTCTGPGFATSDESPFIQDPEHSWHCSICNITPPLRTTHCRKCGRCVLRRDHHCPWLGTCVGLNNHLFFVLYLVFDSIVFIIFIKDTYPVTKLNDDSFIQWFFTSFLCAIICAVGVFGFLQSLLLLPFHIFLILMNKTTWESNKSDHISYLKGWYSTIGPFSRGILLNIKEFVTMRWKNPTYQFPSGSRMEIWKEENSFLVNDKYECC